MTSILWSILLMLARWVLGVSKQFVLATIEAITKAESLKHDDGTPYTGSEKKDYVINELVKNFQSTGVPEWESTVNMIIEIALSFLKSQKTV